MATTVAELQAIITADTSGFDAGVDAANSKLQELGQSAGGAAQGVAKAADQFTTAGKVMGVAGAAILAPMVDAVRGAATLEQGMDQLGVAFGVVQGQSAAMDAQFQEMQDTVNQVASDTIFGAQDVVDAAIQMGKAGVDWETMFGKIGDASDGALGHVADFAAATGTEMPMAAKIAATMANQWGLSADEIGASLDDLTTVFNTTSLGAEDFVGGMANWAPMAKLLNVDLADAAATLGFFKDQGLSAREAGTSLTAMMRAAVNPTDKQAQAMADLGLSTADFFNVAADGTESLKAFPDILDMLNDKTKDLTETQRLQALASMFGLEAFDAVGLGILSNTDDLRDLNKEMENNTGIARKQSAALTDNLLGSIEKLSGSYDVLSNKMGDPFLGPLKMGVDKLNDLVDAAAAAPPELLGAVGQFASLTGGLLTFGAAAALGTGQILKLGEQFAKAGLSLPKFAAGLGLVGLALGAGLLAYDTNFLGFGDAVDSAMANAGEAVDEFGKRFGKIFNEDTAAGMNDVAAGIDAFGRAAKHATAGAIDLTDQTKKLSKAAQAFGDTWQRDMAGGGDPIASFFDSLESAARAAGMGETADQMNKLAAAARKMQESMSANEGKMPELNREIEALKAGAEELTGLPIDKFFNDLGSSLDSARNGVGDFKDQLLQGNLPTALDGLFHSGDAAQGFFNSLGAGLRDATNGLGDFKDDIARMDPTAVFADIGGAFDALGTKVGELDLGSKLQGVSDDLGNWFQDVSDQLMGGVAAGPGGTPIQIEGALPALAQNIADGFGKLPDLVGQKIQEIGNPFDAVGDWLQQGIQDISTDMTGGAIQAGLGGTGVDTGALDTLVNGITGGLEKLPDMVGQKLQSIPNPFDQVGTWLQDGLQQATDFFTGGEATGAGGLGGGPMGVGTPSGIEQAFTGMVQGIADGMGAAAGQIPAILGEQKDKFFGMLGDALGPIGQFLLPSTDAEAAGLGDPAKMGEQFGASLVKSFQDPAFATGINDAVAKLPPETFDSTGAALLGAITGGMGKAMTTADPSKTAQDGAAQTMGQGMVKTLADGLTASLTDTSALDAFIPAANALGSTLSTQFGKAMTSTLLQEGATGMGGKDAAGGIGAQMVKSLATGLTTSLLGKDAADAFIPTVNALGTVLNTAMQAATQQGAAQPGDPSQAGQQQATGFGQQLVQGLATGLAAGITAAKPEVFTPVTDALGAQLSAAMQATQQPTDVVGGPAGGVGTAPQMTGFGTQMVQGLATGLAAGITAAKPEIFTPVTDALGAQLSTAMQATQQTTDVVGGPAGGVGAPQMTGFGTQMVEGLSAGLAAGIVAAKPELFTPVTDALGGQLGAAMQMAATQAPSGPGGNFGPGGMTGTGTGAAGNFGTQMVQGLATGLATGITAADPTLFVPVSNALGAQLGAAMSQASQTIQPPGGVGPTQPATGGLGDGMVTGLATGLTDSITNADPTIFAPVGAALGGQMGTALQTAMQDATAATPVGGVAQGQGAGIGQQMVQQVATGLTDSITSADPAVFAPVGQAIGTQLSTALQTAVDSGAQAGLGGTGGGSDIGAQLGQSVASMMQGGIEQADFTAVGTDMSSKLGEALQTATADMGDAGAQIGDSISQMLESAVSSADFSSVADEISTQLSDALDQAIQEMSDSIGEAMQGVVDSITESLSGIGDAVSEAMSSVEDAVSQMSDAVSEATSAVSDAVSEMQSAVEEAASGMEESASSAAEAMDEMSSAAEEAASAVSSAMSEIASAMQSAAGAAEAAAGQIVAALNSIVAAAGAAAGAVSSIGSMSVPSGGGGAAPQAAEAGAATTQGFAEGMTSNTSPITAAANDLATHTYTAMADAVGMGSPAKKFMPVGASVSQGFLKGMLADAKSRLQSAIGKMSGAVSSAMGKIHSAMQSGMERAHSMVQQAMGKTQQSAAAGGTAAGQAAAGGMADGVAEDSAKVERETERMWKKALKKLLKGKDEMRFLGKDFARNFWEGLMSDASKLDTSGSLDSLDALAASAQKFAESMQFAQFVTEKAVAAAENAIEKVRAKIQGLKSQFDLVTAWIAQLQSELDSVNAELASMDAAAASAASAAADAEAERAGQARVDAAQALLDAQKAITAELEKQFGIEFQEAHQAHIRAAQNPNDPNAQADFQAKLLKAQQTNAGISQSKAMEDTLAQALKAVQEEVKAESAARAAARQAEAAANEAARRAELEARRAALEAEMAEAKRIADAIAAAQHDAQVEYTNTVIQESQKRIEQLQKELHQDKGDPAKLANDRAQIELEKQRVDLANQLAEALAKQAAGGTPEEMAAINAQIQYLTGALAGLDDVDVGAMLQTIVDQMGSVATSMGTAATSMGKAAKAIAGADVAGSMDQASSSASQASGAVQGFGNSAEKATENISGMAKVYNDVLAKMNADQVAFNEQFAGMVAKQQATAEEGGQKIGDALSTDITSKIQAGAPALQSTMLDGLKTGMDQSENAADTGAKAIADTFGSTMRDKLGTQLSDVHKTLMTDGPDAITPMMDDATKVATKGGNDVGTGFGKEAIDGLASKSDKFQTDVDHTISRPIEDAKHTASSGGQDIGHALGDGMSQGVNDRAGQIANDAARIVRDAINAAHDAARTGSPSKEMMEVGDMMGLGLIVGLRGRRGEAKDASAALVHIPRLNPTADGGVSGHRTANDRPHATTIHIDHLELPSVTNPQEFLTAMERMARMNGVSSGRP